MPPTTTTTCTQNHTHAGSQPVAMRTGSITLNFILGDHLGSSSVTTSSTGTSPKYQLYKPFGEVRYTSSALPTKYTFTGQYSNVSDFGLMYYGARWYDVSLGRFAQADTIIPQPGNPQSWDRYSYVNNSPLMYTDPSGHFSEDAITDYLMGYFEGDEEAALRTLQLWKQNTAWWEMISAAQGGDDLTGYFWKTWGDNPRRPCGGDSKDFTAKFIGIGVDFLAGTRGYDLVRLQSREYDGWNVVFGGEPDETALIFGIGYSGGENVSLNGGIDVVLFNNADYGPSIAIYKYKGDGSGAGGGGGGSVYVGFMHRMSKAEDYVGHSTIEVGTLSVAQYGLTGGRFRDDSLSITGGFIGYAPGVQFSYYLYSANYELIWASR